MISSNSAQLITPAELLDENKRLRRENIQLKKEVEEMRSLCNNIFNLISSYANAQAEGSTQGRECGSAATKMPHLMLAKRFAGEDSATMVVEEMRPKLFGTAIGMKRARGEGRSVEDDTALSLRLPVHENMISESSNSGMVKIGKRCG